MIIIAVGFDYLIPDVQCVDRQLVATAAEVLLGKKAVGKRVLVVGGGLVGCETALYAAEELNRKATIIESLDEILVGVEPRCTRGPLNERLSNAGVEIHTGWHLKDVAEKKAVCMDKMEKRHEIEVETVVSAVGLRARKNVVEKFKALAPEVYVMGDCLEARKIHNAFEDA